MSESGLTAVQQQVQGSPVGDPCLSCSSCCILLETLSAELDAAYDNAPFVLLSGFVNLNLTLFVTDAQCLVWYCTGVGLCTLLADNDSAFEEAYCLAFAVLEREWLAMKASYMDFPAVLSRTRKQLESALAARPCSALDLQNLLKLDGSEL